MQEKIIKVYDKLINNDLIVITIVKKYNTYIVEKVILKDNILKLIYKNHYIDLIQAEIKFNKLITN